jgi:hypothetical protein
VEATILSLLSELLVLSTSLQCFHQDQGQQPLAEFEWCGRVIRMLLSLLVMIGCCVVCDEVVVLCDQQQLSVTTGVYIVVLVIEFM